MSYVLIKSCFAYTQCSTAQSLVHLQQCQHICSTQASNTLRTRAHVAHDEGRRRRIEVTLVVVVVDLGLQLELPPVGVAVIALDFGAALALDPGGW